MKKKLKVLAIGAHYDECHYSCGGVLSMLAKAGCECRMLHVAFHRKDLARHEESMRKGAEILGCSALYHGDRNQPKKMYIGNEEDRQILIEEMEAFPPDILFIQWPQDSHPEHHMVAIASYEAMMKAMWKGTMPPIREVYAYEAGPEQSMHYFQPDFYIDITQVFPQVEKALDVCVLESSLTEEKRIAAAFRGHGNCKGGLAEAFKIVKFPGGTGIEESDLMLRKLLPNYFRWAGDNAWPYANQAYLR